MNNQLKDVVFSGIVTVRDKLLQLDNPLRLESGEPSFDTPSHIKEAFIKAINDNHSHYAPSTGIKPFREACLKKIIERNSITNIDSANKIEITSGGMHALFCTMRTILNEGDQVIVPQPNWTATNWIIKMCGGTPVPVRLNAELGFNWDPEELASKINPSVKAILINSPHNPTGGVMGKENLLAVLKLAEENDLYVVSDEAYEDIVYDNEHISIASLASDFSRKTQDKIISVFTFSKSYAMTGYRLGYLACSSDEFADLVKKTILYSINGVSTPSQYAGIAALEGPQDCVVEMRNKYKERRDILFAGINSSEFLKVDSPPGGAFYMYAQIKDTWEGSAWDMVNYLIDSYSMGAVPGDIFTDDQKAIRFSYACETEMIEKAVENLNSPQKVVNS